MNYKVYQDDTELEIRTASIYPSPYLEKRKMEYVQFSRKRPDAFDGTKRRSSAQRRDPAAQPGAEAGAGGRD